MRLYEVVYIFDPALDEDGVNAKLERYHEVVTADGGEVVAVDHWGARQLAYPIGKRVSGYYAVAHLRADPESLPELERVVRLDEDLVRFLLVLNEGEPTSGESIHSEAPPSQLREVEHEDDDDEEEEDEDELEEEERDEDDESPPEFSGGRGRRRRVEGPAIELLNYKDVQTLARFMTEQGKIIPKRTTKVNAAFQRQLGRAIKRARFLALIPYVRDHEA